MSIDTTTEYDGTALTAALTISGGSTSGSILQGFRTANSLFVLSMSSAGRSYLATTGAQSQIHLQTGTTVGSATTKMTIEANGDALINDGNLVIGTAGHGIDFSVTSDGSGTDTSELLDDYEEGSFSPTISTPSSNVSYTQQFGNYVKVGRLVTFNLSININVVTSAGSGSFEIAGLPYASASTNINNTRFVCQTSTVDFDSNYYSFYAFTPSTSVSTLRILYTNDNGTWSVATAVNFAIGNSDAIVITGQYYTD